MNLSLIPIFEQQLETPVQSALRLYESSEKIRVSMELGKSKFIAGAALVQSWRLAEIFDGEQYAATSGGMFFVTNVTPRLYWPFATFHEMADHAALRGFDVTGLAAHFQAIVVELAYARRTLPSREYDEYLVWRKSVERTNFFAMKDDGLIERVSERMGEVFDSLSYFLKYRGKLLVEIHDEK